MTIDENDILKSQTMNSDVSETESETGEGTFNMTEVLASENAELRVHIGYLEQALEQTQAQVAHELEMLQASLQVRLSALNIAAQHSNISDDILVLADQYASWIFNGVNGGPESDAEDPGEAGEGEGQGGPGEAATQPESTGDAASPGA